jgi:membrane fusion protein, multidrug efflux system
MSMYPVRPIRTALISTFHTLPVPLLLAALLLSGCAKKDASQGNPEIVEVGVITLVAGAVTTSTELTGRTAPTLIAEVRPQVDGVIKERFFKEGSVVHAGQTLYQIDPALYQASLEQITAQLESSEATSAAAEAKAERYHNLTDIEAVSLQDADDIKAAARQAKASVHQNRASQRMAQINLAYTHVQAPITGRIGRSSVTPGALVTANQATALATIQQLDPIYVDITQSSEQLLQLRRALASGSVLPANATARLRFDDGSAYAHLGTVEFAEVAVTQDSGTVTLRARFENPDGLLLPGMFVRVEVPQSVHQNAILAPQQGIARDAKGNATALVVMADNKVAQRPVIASQAIGDQWLITSGLSAGDRLMVEGTGKVKIGDVVKPVAVTLKPAA